MPGKQKAQEFAALHAGEDALLLPNCWDSASARILEQIGFPAIATASAAISWSHGVADVEHLTRDEMIASIERIARSVRVPVTADIEKGYGATPNDVGETVRRVIGAGAVGINIEDSTSEGTQRSIADMQRRIHAARVAAQTADIPLFINARMDGYLLGHTGEGVFRDTVARAKAWFEAGADCVFAPGAGGPELIGRLVSHIEGPLNVIVLGADTPSLRELSALGVRRVSLGPRLMQATLGALRAFAQSVKEQGDFRFLAGAPAFDEINGLFIRDR